MKRVPATHAIMSVLVIGVLSLFLTGCGRRPEAGVKPTELVLSGSEPAPAVELLRNPSFEATPDKSTGEGRMPAEWIIVSSTPDTYSNDGSYGLPPHSLGNFTGITAHDGIRWVAGWSASPGERFGQVLSQPLTSGQAYVLSGYFIQARRSDLIHSGTYEVSLARDKTLKSNLVLGRFLPLIDNSNGWEYRELRFVAPKEAGEHPLLVFLPVDPGEGRAYPGVDFLSLRAEATQADCEAILRKLQSGEKDQKAAALAWLAQSPPRADCRAEIARKLSQMLQEPGVEQDLRREATKALVAWATPDQIGALLPLLKSEDAKTRQAAIRALGRLKHQASAAILVEALATDRAVASEALRQLGPAAERDVLNLLERAKEPVIRREAMVVLTAIGGRDSLPALQRHAKDADAELARTAQVAIAVIERRLKAAEKGRRSRR